MSKFRADGTSLLALVSRGEVLEGPETVFLPLGEGRGLFAGRCISVVAQRMRFSSQL